MVDLYADMFELAPVSLWLEDYSLLKQLFEAWRREGVQDLRGHLRQRPDRVADCMRQLRVLRVNQRTLSQFGARDLDHLRSNLHQVMREETRTPFVEEMGQLWDGQLRLSTETVNYTLDGHRLNLLLKGHVLPGHESRWDRVLVSLEDVTERQRALDRAQALFEHSPVSLWRMDLSAVRRELGAACPAACDRATVLAAIAGPGVLRRCLERVQVLDVNQRTLDLLGAADKASLMAALPAVFGAPLKERLAGVVAGLWLGERVQESEITVHSLDDRVVHGVLQVSLLPGHLQDWGQALVSLTDISARKQAETELAWVSTHDALTGLRNRSFFNEALVRHDATSEGLTVVAIDLDGLKETNDTHGHAAGDELLRRAGRLIAALVEPPALAARMGGDEFALLFPGMSGRTITSVLARLEQALAQDNAGRPQLDALRMSIGVAERMPGEAAGAALLRADAAMYCDKRRRYAERGSDRRSGCG